MNFVIKNTHTHRHTRRTMAKRKVTPTPSHQSQQQEGAALEANAIHHRRKRKRDSEASNAATANDGKQTNSTEEENGGSVPKRPRHDDNNDDGDNNGENFSLSNGDAVGILNVQNGAIASGNRRPSSSSSSSSSAALRNTSAPLNASNDRNSSSGTHNLLSYARSTRANHNDATLNNTHGETEDLNSRTNNETLSERNQNKTASANGQVASSNSKIFDSSTNELISHRDGCRPGNNGNRGRIKWQHSSHLLIALSIGFFISFLPLTAVIYTLHSNHNLTRLQRVSHDIMTMDKYTTILQSREQILEQTKQQVQTIQGQLKLSQQTIQQLRQEMNDAEKLHKIQLEEYDSIIHQHQQSLIETHHRLDILRGSKENTNSALDMAWLRMDELMEENHDLSNQLKLSLKEQKVLLFQLQTKDADEAQKLIRERELLHKVESLTEQLEVAKEESTAVRKEYTRQSRISESTLSDYQHLQYTHHYTMNTFLAPMLVYIQKLQRTSEQQHAIILELTSLVHSLHSSLEMSRANSQLSTIESMDAVTAVAHAANEIALEKEEKYQIERESYMHHMEYQLERLEDEALGAVQAVAEAAGKLEYERKVEEEGRWRGYVQEVEKVLGGIGAGAEDDVTMMGSSRRNNNVDGIDLENGVDNSDITYVGNAEEYYSRAEMGMVETSVLRAAISRRIEEGIVSLRGYIRPYSYFGEGASSSHAERRG